jgi:hypothetical protein
MVVPGLEGVPRDDADPYAQEFHKILEQADVIKKGGAWLEVHQQVQIAVWVSLSPGDRAEHSDPVSSALPRDAEDFLAAAAQPFQGQHVIGHRSRVSPSTRARPLMTPSTAERLGLPLSWLLSEAARSLHLIHDRQ